MNAVARNEAVSASWEEQKMIAPQFTTFYGGY
jgi:hypothetical protein